MAGLSAPYTDMTRSVSHSVTTTERSDTQCHDGNVRSMLPKDPHSAIICGQTGCGKTVFSLSLLEGPYQGVFKHIVILCPTVRFNQTYQQCPWIWSDPEVYIVDPGERLHDYLWAFYQLFQGEPTLYIIDDCSASKALTKKKDMLSDLAFSGRHADQSVWVLTQKYNSVLRVLRTSANRHAGLLCFTVKTGTRLKSACVRMTSCPLGKSGLLLASCLLRQNTPSSC